LKKKTAVGYQQNCYSLFFSRLNALDKFLEIDKMIFLDHCRRFFIHLLKNIKSCFYNLFVLSKATFIGYINKL